MNPKRLKIGVFPLVLIFLGMALASCGNNSQEEQMLAEAQKTHLKAHSVLDSLQQALTQLQQVRTNLEDLELSYEEVDELVMGDDLMENQEVEEQLGEMIGEIDIWEARYNDLKDTFIELEEHPDHEHPGMGVTESDIPIAEQLAVQKAQLSKIEELRTQADSLQKKAALFMGV